MNNISKEEHRLLRFNSCDRPSLNPLRELIDGDKQVGEAPERFLAQPDNVQTLDRKRLSDVDRLKRLGW
jgi:hypothetical protein